MPAAERRLKEALERASAARSALVAAHAGLEPLLGKTDDPAQRGLVNAFMWDCAALSEDRRRYFSQYGQDAFLDRCVFDERRDGVFVEVGGFDGVTGSNSLFFELFRGWSGLLIEAVEAHCREAAAFRRCPCEAATVAGGAGEAAFLEIAEGPVQMSGLVETYDPRRRAWVESQPARTERETRRQTVPLADLLTRHGLTRIDFISLDVEGAELAILKSFPFDRFDVSAWVIESLGARPAIAELMRAQGYAWAETFGDDDIYLRPAAS